MEVSLTDSRDPRMTLVDQPLDISLELTRFPKATSPWKLRPGQDSKWVCNPKGTKDVPEIGTESEQSQEVQMHFNFL